MATCACRASAKDEGKVGGSEVEHPIGQVAARLIPERQHTLLDQPQNVLAPIAEVEDVVDVLDLDRIAEAGLEPIADFLERQAESGGGRPVPAHHDPDSPFGGAGWRRLEDGARCGRAQPACHGRRANQG